MVKFCVDFMGMASIVHYRIKRVEYNRSGDYFRVKLQSHFENFPEINIQVNYYRSVIGTKAGYSFADTDDPNYVLNVAARRHVENISEIVTHNMRKVLKSGYM